MHEIFQNLAELDYLLEMNFPEYNKTRLDPKIRAKFIKSYNSKFNLDYYMDLLKANRNRQLIQNADKRFPLSVSFQQNTTLPDSSSILQ